MNNRWHLQWIQATESVSFKRLRTTQVMEQRALKNMKYCLNTNIYSY